MIKLLTTHPVEGRDLYGRYIVYYTILNYVIIYNFIIGMKISTRALEKLTPQEISDLKMVFEAFDYRNVG